MTAKKINAIAERIASELLTPNGGSECHRLQIMERVGPLKRDEHDMGGHCKASIVAIVRQVLTENER